MVNLEENCLHVGLFAGKFDVMPFAVGIEESVAVTAGFSHVLVSTAMFVFKETLHSVALVCFVQRQAFFIIEINESVIETYFRNLARIGDPELGIAVIFRTVFGRRNSRFFREI